MLRYKFLTLLTLLLLANVFFFHPWGDIIAIITLLVIFYRIGRDGPSALVS